MTSKHIHFNTDDEKSKKLLEKIQNKSKYFEKLFSDVANGKLNYDELTVKEKIDIQKLELFKEKNKLAVQKTLHEIQKIRISTCIADNVELYFKTFGTYPSKTGLRALQEHANHTKNHNQTFKKITYLPKFIIRKNNNFGFNGLCKICEELFENQTEEFLIEKLEGHVRYIHHRDAYDEIKN